MISGAQELLLSLVVAIKLPITSLVNDHWLESGVIDHRRVLPLNIGLIGAGEFGIQLTEAGSGCELGRSADWLFWCEECQLSEGLRRGMLPPRLLVGVRTLALWGEWLMHENQLLKLLFELVVLALQVSDALDGLNVDGAPHIQG